tara:strand:- start:1387 stop:2298 length:912 start_codon:yes stop_codon:yes gene_type:complete
MSHTTNLFRYLNTLSSEELHKCLLHNGVLGLSYERSDLLPSTHAKDAKTQYLKQWQQNQGYLKFLSAHAQQLAAIDESITILKGCALLSDIYVSSLGARFMSDVDMLIDATKRDAVVKYLESAGLTSSRKQTWYGDAHKVEMHGVFEGIQLTVELHTKLFYHQDNFEFETVPCHQFYKKMAPEYQLVHLISHFCFQHTMQKLYWFFDIALFLESHHKTLNWYLVNEIARQWGVYNSYCYTLGAINQHWKKLAPSIQGRFQHLIDEEFLASDNQRTFKYLFLKLAFKDSVKLNFKYSLGWLGRR